MKTKSLKISGKKRRIQSAPTSTRDVVETAIDLAKSDYCLTWEEQLAKSPRKVSLWEIREASQRNEKTVGAGVEPAPG